MPRTAKPMSPAAVRARARQLRRPLTPAEQVLWQHLRNRNFGGKFRRQRPIGPFIVDFCCDEARLVVELDGESHHHAVQRERDDLRTEWLEEKGKRGVRVWEQGG